MYSNTCSIGRVWGEAGGRVNIRETGIFKHLHKKWWGGCLVGPKVGRSGWERRGSQPEAVRA